MKIKKMIATLGIAFSLLAASGGLTAHAYYAAGSFREVTARYQQWSGSQEIINNPTYTTYYWVVNRGIYDVLTYKSVSTWVGGHALYQTWHWWAN